MKVLEIKRRFGTEYFYDVRDQEAALASKGAASTEQGAIRAAVVRVFMGQYRKARVVDRYTGVTIYTIRVGAGGIQVHYGSGVEFKQFKKA